MRIGIGLILLADLCIRALSIKAHYSDEGVLPISVLREYNWQAFYFSFHTLSGNVWFEAMLFVLNALCVLCLIVGYRTRLFTFICWTFLVSLQNRNPFILQGGDDLLRLTLFWGFFLPWGRAYSIQYSPVTSYSYFSFANIGYILLVASVYFFSAMLKTSVEWHSDGSAIYYALSIDQMRLPLGTVLYQFPGAMTFLTHFVYWLEVVAPLLLIVPLFTKRLRLIGLIALFCLHIGIVSTLYVGLFYLIGITTLIGMLPPFVMDAFETRILKRPLKNISNQDPEKHHTGKLNRIVQWGISVYCIAIICYCLILNLGQIKWFKYELRYELLSISHLFRLEQSWGMFSPAVLKDDGWYVYEGFTTDNKYIDIKNNRDTVNFEKPQCGVDEYESDRWRKFGENYTFNNNNHMRPYFCKYLIREWNNKHPDKKITEANVFYMQETTLPGYQTKPVQKIAVCNCRGN